MTMHSKAILACAALWLSAPAGAQAQTAAELTMTAVRLQAGESIALDGTLSHPAWQRAPVHDRFVGKFPLAGATPVQGTKAQVLFDDQAL